LLDAIGFQMVCGVSAPKLLGIAGFNQTNIVMIQILLVVPARATKLLFHAWSKQAKLAGQAGRQAGKQPGATLAAAPAPALVWAPNTSSRIGSCGGVCQALGPQLHPGAPRSLKKTTCSILSSTTP